MMRRLLIVAILVLVGLVDNAPATEQIKDQIVLGGKSYSIWQSVMRGLWRKESEEEDGRALMPPFMMRSTANRRGYLASFIIKDESLYLNSLKGRVLLDELSNSDIIPKPFPVLASWYTGSIFVPVGGYDRKTRCFRYVIEFCIVDGKITETKYSDGRMIPRTWNGVEETAE